jgi:hypothetical protein
MAADNPWDVSILRARSVSVTQGGLTALTRWRDTYRWSLVRVEHRRALEHVLSVREALTEPAGRMRRRQSLLSCWAVASERFEIAPRTLAADNRDIHLWPAGSTLR